jgi:hypothetical protein
MATAFVFPERPPTVERLAWDWAEKIAEEHHVKVTVTLERDGGGFHELSIDKRPNAAKEG